MLVGSQRYSLMRYLSIPILCVLLAGCDHRPVEEEPQNDEDATEVDHSKIEGAFSYSIERDFEQRIGRQRSERRVGDLERHGCLNTAAREWSVSMAKAGDIAQNSGIARTVVRGCGRYFLFYEWLSEHVHKGGSSEAMWAEIMTRPQAVKLMQSPKANSVGVGAYQTADGEVFVTYLLAAF